MAFVLVFSFVNKTNLFHNLSLKYFYDKYRRYSMVWCWIWYLFHAWDRIFFFMSRKHKWKYYKVLSHAWNKFHIQHQIIEFSVYYICYSFWTCFFQILTIAQNTWHDITIDCYFHTMEILLLIFSQCKNSSLWKTHFYSMDKTRYIIALLLGVERYST